MRRFTVIASLLSFGIGVYLGAMEMAKLLEGNMGQLHYDLQFERITRPHAET